MKANNNWYLFITKLAHDNLIEVNNGELMYRPVIDILFITAIRAGQLFLELFP